MYALGYVGTFVLGLAFLVTLILARGVQVALRKSYGHRSKIAGDLHKANRGFWSWLLIITAATSVGLWAQLPLRLGFLISRPALNHLADEALANPDQLNRFASGWAGIYQVTRVEVIGATVIVYLGDFPFGFARVPSASSDTILNNEHSPESLQCKDFPIRQGFESCEGRRISGDWFVTYSWYQWNKVGPS